MMSEAIMKIKKNLSDEEMFQGYEEVESFENAILKDDSRHKSFKGKQAAAEKEMLLPAEAQEKLNRCLLEVSMEWLKGNNGDVEWKVIREGTTITIKPSPAKKKDGRL